MPTDFLPRKKGDLFAWTNNFITVATANLTTIGFTAADTTALTTAQTNFTSAINGINAAKATLKAAVQAEKTATKALTNLVRSDVRRIQSVAAVTPMLKGQLGINPRTTVKNHEPPITPIGLQAEGFSNGVNSLKWNRATNKPGTVFQIQAKVGTATDFVGVSATTATKFDHSGQTPGVKVTYRVVASRAGMLSAPSAAAIVYENNATTVLTLAKAA